MTETAIAKALFAPDAVALIGASGDAAKNTARPQLYLRKHGFRGRVYPVNPGRAEVLGERAWPGIAAAAEAAADAGAAIEHAYIMTPAATVPALIDACAAADVRVATIYSDGFAETGEDGIEVQENIVAAARAHGMRILGPNSMGVVNAHTGFAMTTNAALETDTLIPGPLAVVSQSGTALGALLSRGQARGFGFSRLFSIGNEADLSVGEMVDMLTDDSETGAIVLFLETIRRHDALARAARRAYQAGKPVIAYKLGRSAAGRRMAVSHSGALAGPDEAADAFFRAHGILRVDTLEALFETPYLVRGHRPAASRRVAVMTTTGGGASTVVDRLGLAGADFAPPPMPVVARLMELDLRVGDAPVIDLTMAGARADVYGPVLKGLLDDDQSDVLVCVVGSSAQFRPDVAVDPIVDVIGTGAAKPVAVFCVPEAGQSLKRLAGAGIAGFRTPESCADAVRAYLDWRPPAPEVSTDSEALGAVAAVLDGAGAANGTLDAAASLAAFAALGIASAPHRMVESVAEAGAVDLAYPLAAKVVSADIPHKTEAGGVIIDIGDAAALATAVGDILENARQTHPRADVAGVMVQSMETGVAEALVGYRLDAEAGPVVLLGVGGTLTELMDDAVVRAAPVTIEEARAMVARVRGLAPVRGYRGQPPGDAEALAAAVVAVSTLARLDGPMVVEAEINPLMVKPLQGDGGDNGSGGGVVAVDGLVVLAR